MRTNFGALLLAAVLAMAAKAPAVQAQTVEPQPRLLTVSGEGIVRQKTIAVLATLDTKGREAAYIREHIESRGHRALLGHQHFRPAGGFDANNSHACGHCHVVLDVWISQFLVGLPRCDNRFDGRYF